ncbi:MAG: peptidylprolyl isomerase [Mediterranea massiliensis]|nr:peptidylprolyl isomerase [Mediterranea massiliensis]
MKETTWTLSLLFALLMGIFTACEEVEEVSEYDNWQERNEAFIDSLEIAAAGSLVATVEQAKQVPVGKLFAIKVSSVSTDINSYYIYCKKLTANPEGVRPYYTSSVTTYYYGTDILGKRFDGNFTGYSAIEQGNLDGSQRMPTPFDSPTTFPVNGLIAGWTTALQYMHSGERWMMYIPWQCAYGSEDSGTILAYSALTFDVILNDVEL